MRIKLRIKSPQQKRLDQLMVIYLLYGFVDGVNLSYSVLKYFFDIISTKTGKNANNMMHNWLSSSEGIAGFVFTGVFITFSMFGNFFKDGDKNFFKRYTAQLWPYVRDVIKSAKNAYKGVRSVLYTMHRLGFLNYTNLFLLGAAGIFGAASIATRLGLRAFRNNRKAKQTKYQVLAEELLLGYAYEWYVYPDGLPSDRSALRPNSYVLVGDPISRTYRLEYINGDCISEKVDNNAVNVNLLLIALDESDKKKRQAKIHELLKNDPKKDERFIWSIQRLDALRKNIKKATIRQRAYGYVASGTAGFIDGMYLYMGLYAITSVMPPAFILITVLSSLYLLVSITTRIYEEHEYQVRLNLSAVRAELVSWYRERESISRTIMKYCALLESANILASDSQPSSADSQLLQKVLQEIPLYITAKIEFEKACQEEKRLRRLSNLSAVLFGLKNGITVYGVIAACLFAVSTFLALASVVFPPILLIAGVCLGVVCLIGFSAYAMHENKKKQAAALKSEQQYSVVTPYEQHINQLIELYESQVENEAKLFSQMRDIKNTIEGVSAQQDVVGDKALLDETEKQVRAVKKDNELLEKTSGAMGNDLDPNAGLRLTGEKESKLRDVSEIVRSVFSGCTKGVKWVVLFFNKWLNLDEAGNNHDSTVTFVLTGIATAINMVVLGARAWAKGFGLEWVKNAPKPIDSGASSPLFASQNYTCYSQLSALLSGHDTKNDTVEMAPTVSVESKSGSGSGSEASARSQSGFHDRNKFFKKPFTIYAYPKELPGVFKYKTVSLDQDADSGLGL